MWDPWLHYFASTPFLSLGTFLYWKLQPFFHFSSLGPWPLTPFASLAAKVRYLNIWPCLFSPLLYQIKEAQGWAVLWHISKDYCGQADGTQIWVDKTKNLCKAEEWPAWLFYFGFWVPRIFETGRNATYTEYPPFFYTCTIFSQQIHIKISIKWDPISSDTCAVAQSQLKTSDFLSGDRGGGWSCPCCVSRSLQSPGWAEADVQQQGAACLFVCRGTDFSLSPLICPDAAFN